MKTVFDMSTGQVVERYSAKDECSLAPHDSE